ncbi:2'-5' RNA ligase family protein [Streptomyces sp. NPDC004012]
MTDVGTSRFAAGRTGLVVGIPEAEPAVRAWRERFDPSARAGVPAHVTVLFPFLDERRVDERVCSALADALGRQRAFDLRFEGCGRFPGVLYLARRAVSTRSYGDVRSALWPHGRSADSGAFSRRARAPSSGILQEPQAQAPSSRKRARRVSRPSASTSRSLGTSR